MQERLHESENAGVSNSWVVNSSNMLQTWIQLFVVVFWVFFSIFNYSLSYYEKKLNSYYISSILNERKGKFYVRLFGVRNLSITVETMLKF